VESAGFIVLRKSTHWLLVVSVCYINLCYMIQARFLYKPTWNV